MCVYLRDEIPATNKDEEQITVKDNGPSWDKAKVVSCQISVGFCARKGETIGELVYNVHAPCNLALFCVVSSPVSV